METKLMRPLEDIMKDLTYAANDIKMKKNKLEELSKAQSVAASDLDTAQRKALDLRREMEEFLNLLVPASAQGRVRVS